MKINNPRVRELIVELLPFWLWKLAVGDIKKKLRTFPIRTLVNMAEYPDNKLDRRSMHCKVLVFEVIKEHYNGNI